MGVYSNVNRGVSGVSAFALRERDTGRADQGLARRASLRPWQRLGALRADGMGRRSWTVCVGLVGAAAASTLAAPAALAVIPAYVQQGSFSLPSSGSAFDVGSDGRAWVVTEAGGIVRQTAVNGSAFAPVGSLPGGLVHSFGAGFIRVSPDGARLAIGDNGTVNQMWIVPAGSLSTGGPTTPQTVSVPNFDAAWTDNATLYVNGSPSFGSPPSLYRVNVTGNTVAAAVTNIGDGSGGVASRAGRVFTAIGYDVGGVLDGQVRSFDLPTLNVAGSSVVFSTGLLATQATTGNSLAFDTAGNLIEAGFGGVTIEDLSMHQRTTLPGLSATGFYTAAFNAATSEILVRDFGATSVLRYGVPAPGGAFALGLTGLLAARRRRA